ncbi:MAG: VWA domain-containing protein [Candidatus Hermodarchaeota archaeon]
MSPKEIFAEETVTSLPEDKREAIDRWRLILGKDAEDHDFNFSDDEPSDQEQEQDEGEGEEGEGEEGEGEEGEGEGEGEGDEGQDEGEGESEEGEGEGEGEEKEGEGEEGEGEGEGEEGEGEGEEEGEEQEGKGSKKLGKGGKKPGKGGKGMGVGKGMGAGKAMGAGKGMGTGKAMGAGMGKGGGKPSGARQKGFNKEKLMEMDDTLDLVYGGSEDQRGSAGLGPSNLSIPDWIENVKEFFPTDAKEVLEKDLVERSDIKDIIANPELFEKVEPSLEMVKTIISLKHLLPNEVKDVARNVVRKVVENLKDKFKDDVEKHIIGAIKRDIHTPVKVYRNVDWKDSIRRNLKNYDPNSKKLIMAEPRFYSAEKKKKPWQIVILIDESGSMTDSIIYSVVIASIFATLPAVHTNLVIFDTQVVDLSDRIDDPVEVLMTVQLGGGTDITKAVQYGHSLIKNPKKTIMVLISDFYEGGSYHRLTETIKQVLEGQTKILGIAALDYNNEPMYDRDYAKTLNSLGIDVIASTPNNLPEIIAKLMQ